MLQHLGGKYHALRAYERARGKEQLQQIKDGFSGVQFKTFKQLKAEYDPHHKEFYIVCVSNWFSFVSSERPPQVEAGLQTWEITEATDT